MSNNYNPLNNWGNQDLVVENRGDRTTAGIRRKKNVYSTWALWIIFAMLIIKLLIGLKALVMGL